MTIRTSPLGEIKVLSAASLRERLSDDTTYAKWMSNGSQGDRGDVLRDFYSSFVSIGLARSVRIDEDWGTTNVYGIGNPSRPEIIPNNYSVSVTVERLQLDRRNNWHYSLSPDYWYSKEWQNQIGTQNWLSYTFLTVKDRESKQADGTGPEIYALMPRSASQAVTSQDVMVVHSVQYTGYKYKYQDLIGNILRGDMLGFGRTAEYTPTEPQFGDVTSESSLRADGGIESKGGK